MSREIDQRIAVEVMGWKWEAVGFHWDDEKNPPLYLIEPGKKWHLMTTSGSWDENNVAFDMPSYSEDMNAAMEVVLALWKKGWDAEIQIYSDLRGAIKCRARFAKIDDQEVAVVEFADTPSLATCLAALEAVKK